MDPQTRQQIDVVLGWMGYSLSYTEQDARTSAAAPPLTAPPVHDSTQPLVTRRRPRVRRPDQPVIVPTPAPSLGRCWRPLSRVFGCALGSLLVRTWHEDV